jgi:hypothetical protein
MFCSFLDKVVPSTSIICFVKTVLLTERGYEYEVLGDEVSGDVRQSS